MRSDAINRITVSSTARAPSPELLKIAPDLASPCCPSKENTCFKDSISINSSGAPNLSLEPQKMKRKKKGGKHNLRKSLAWDRAFFTEEGVLDPLELSSISGLSCRGGLSFISEDTPASSGQDEDSRKYKENNLSSLKLHFSTSNRMTSTSLASHRVPTNIDRKYVSKCGDCPRPLPSPSLKRPANANIGKATVSELKLPKVPGLKPGLTPTCATTRNRILRGSGVKHNHITQPDFSNQSVMELKSSFRSHKKNQNASRATTLQSSHHSVGNPGSSSSFNSHLSINMIPMTVDKANSGLKINPVKVTQSRLENSCDSQLYDSTIFSTSYTQKAQSNDRNLLPLQNQTTKPSGLRMPSPSLSFFSQPKPSVFRDLPSRDAYSDVFGSQNPGSVRLLDNLSKTTKSYDKIPDRRISSSKTVCSRPESSAASHSSVIDLIKSNLEQSRMYEVGLDVHSDVSNSHPGDKKVGDNNNVFDGQIQDLPKKNVIMRISHEEAEMQKIATEVHPECGSLEKALDNFLENAIGNCPVKSDSRGSEWRNAELVSKHSYAIPESQITSAVDGQPEKNKQCSLVALNYNSTHCTEGFDDRVENTSTLQSDWRKSSKPDCHEAHLEKTDSLKYSLQENEKRTDRDICWEKEKVTEQLDVFQQNGIYCSEMTKALEWREAMAESLYIDSKHLYATEVLTDNLPAAEAHMHTSVCVSTVDDCMNDTNLTHEVGNDINQPGESPTVQDFNQKFATESNPKGNLNISDRLLAAKQLLLQNIQQKENVDELPVVASDREEGNKVIDTKMFSLPLGKRHKGTPAIEADIAQTLRLAMCDSVGSSFSSKSCNSPIRTSSDDGSSSYGNLLVSLHQDSPRIETNDGSISGSTMHQLSPDATLIKKTEELPCIQVGSVDNGLISSMSLKDSKSDINNLKDLQDTRTLLVQSSESNILHNCYFRQSECSAFAGDELVAENLVHSNDFMQAKHFPDVQSEVNAGGSTEDSVPSENEVFRSISRSSTPGKESPLKHAICNEEYGTGGVFEDTITDPSRVEAFSNTVKVGASKDANNSLCCISPKLDHDKVETTLISKNEHGDGLQQKSLSVVIPPNATPFSDEWLAAIEAAGEDILTRKSGAVQNSPPDKSQPEPSPWSPVKRKNNQIGPFDCTKKIHAPSHS